MKPKKEKKDVPHDRHVMVVSSSLPLFHPLAVSYGRKRRVKEKRRKRKLSPHVSKSKIWKLETRKRRAE